MTYFSLPLHLLKPAILTVVFFTALSAMGQESADKYSKKDQQAYEILPEPGYLEAESVQAPVRADNKLSETQVVNQTHTPLLREDNMAYGWTVVSGDTGIDTGPVTLSLEDGSLESILSVDTDVIWMTGGDMIGDDWYTVSQDHFNCGLYIVNPLTGEYSLVGYTGFNRMNGLAYDDSNDILYAVRYDGDTSQLYTVDPETGSAVHVGSIIDGIVIGIAVDNDGELYGIRLADNGLYSINGETGEATLIGSLEVNINYAQDIGFDRDNDILYGTLFKHETLEGGLYTISTETGKASHIETFIAELTAFAIPYTYAEDGAPEKVSDLTIVPAELGELEAEISWTNPTQTVAGDNLQNISSLVIERDGQVIASLDGYEPGETVSYTDEVVPEARVFTYRVYAVNEEGEGMKNSRSQYVGEDVPVAPDNLVLEAVGDDGSLTWDKPTEGVHGAYLSGENITYTLIRRPDNVLVDQNVEETSYIDTDVPETGTYYYNVIASNHIGEGGSAESNIVLLIPGDYLLYDFFEIEKFPPAYWNYVNGIEGAHWKQTHIDSYKGDFSLVAYHGGLSDRLADEWLITPKVDFDELDNAILRFFGNTQQPADGLRENLRVMELDEAYDSIEDLHANATLIEVVSYNYENREWREYVVDLSHLSGEKHIAFHNYFTEEDDAAFCRKYVDQVSIGNYETHTMTMLEPEGAGTVNPEPGEHLFTNGYEMTLRAETEHTWAFDRWEVNGETYSNAKDTVITIVQDIEVQAIVLAEDSYTLSMQEPEGSGNVSPAPGDHLYYPDETVQVSARSEMGWQFSHWEGDVQNETIPLTSIVMDDDKTLKAHFEEFDYFDLPYTEDFSNTVGGLPENWSRDVNNWSVVSSNVAGGTPPEMRLTKNPLQEGELYLISPQINTEGHTSLQLYFRQAFDTAFSPDEYTLQVKAIADGNEYLIEEWITPGDMAGHEVEFELTAEDHGIGTEEFQLAWVFVGETRDIDAWYIDDIFFGKEPEYANITFHVMEDSPANDPIPGATVVMEGEQIVTGEDGMVTVELMEGSYTATVSAHGYVAGEVSFEVAGQDKTLEVYLMDDIQEPFNLSVETEGLDPGQALFRWNDYGTEYEFRHDDGIVDAQLGYQEGTWNSLMGSAHHYDAVVHEMTWYLTDEGGSHNKVKVWVLGLDDHGLPDKENILYSQEGVSNTNHQWNTYEFSDPIEAPDGFYIALSYDGFLGLAVDDGIGAPWEFTPGTQFGISDITNPDFVFQDVEQWGFEVNFLIRAYGESLGELHHEKIAHQAAPACSAPLLIPVSSPEIAGDPKGVKGQKVFEEFVVYLDGQEHSTGITETNYLFTDLVEGTYTAGVQAVYSTGSSSIVETDFEIEEGVGVEDPDAFSYTVYPNPATDNLYIESGQHISQVKLINMVGQTVYAGSVSDTWHQIDVSDLYAGMYFLQITTREGTVTEKIQVTK